MERLGWSGYQPITNFLDIQVPCIAAINGPTELHSELALLCDIVLASEEATLMGRSHFARGVVPGDGTHIVWPLVVGQNRARYFLTTDLRLTAQGAKDWVAVNEVVPKDQVPARAYELAQKPGCHMQVYTPPATAPSPNTDERSSAIVRELPRSLGAAHRAQTFVPPPGLEPGLCRV